MNERLFRLMIGTGDLFVLYGSYLLAFFLLFGNDIPDRNWDSFMKLAPWVGIAALIIFNFFDLYSSTRRREYHHFVYSVIMSVCLLLIAMLAVSFWVRGFAMPRSVLLLGTLLEMSVMLTVRTLIWFVQLKLGGRKKVLIVGRSAENGVKIAEKFLKHSKGWFDFAGFLTIDDKKLIADSINHADVVMITPELTGEEKGEILSYSSRYMKEVLIVPELYELFLMGAETQQVDDMLVFSVMPPSLSAGELLMKRWLDILVSLISLLILSPLMLLLLLIIPITSKGSPIYSQERVGRNGKTYSLYKFRSMIVNAESRTGPVLALEKDPRITWLGRIMRSTRIDELPQLLNVLKGDMSLVGPRPERPIFIDRFKKEIPDYMYRIAVKPGITGLAQVMAKYSTNVEDKLRYDLMYIRNYTILLDIKILFQTVLVVFRGTQAKGISLDSENREKILKTMITDPEVHVNK